MDLSHDSTTILGQLRKGQAEANARLDAIRVELQRLNVHLEQLAATLNSRPHDAARPYPGQGYLSQVLLTLRPKALAMWSQMQTLPRSFQAKKPIPGANLHREVPPGVDNDPSGRPDSPM
jgi:hypothetical protein